MTRLENLWQDVAPDPSCLGGQIPQIDFDAAQTSWRDNKFWDEKKRELRYVQQANMGPRERP